MPELKECTKCKAIKDISEFRIRMDTGRHKGSCRACEKEYFRSLHAKKKEYKLKKNKEWYEKNKDKIKENVRLWRKENPDKVAVYRAIEREKRETRMDSPRNCLTSWLLRAPATFRTPTSRERLINRALARLV